MEDLTIFAERCWGDSCRRKSSPASERVGTFQLPTRWNIRWKERGSENRNAREQPSRQEDTTAVLIIRSGGVDSDRVLEVLDAVGRRSDAHGYPSRYCMRNKSRRRALQSTEYRETWASVLWICRWSCITSRPRVWLNVTTK